MSTPGRNLDESFATRPGRRGLAAAVLVIVILPAFIAAQERPAQDPEPPVTIRVESNLVLLRFHVIHKRGYAVDLTPEDFRIEEDGKQQEVSVWDSPGLSTRKLPFELILLIDNSGTVEGLIDYSSLVRTLIAGLREGAFLSVYSFSHDLRCLARPTRDLAVLDRALKAALGPPGFGTRLFAAVESVCETSAVSEAGGVQTVLIISDGLASDVGRRKSAVVAAQKYGIRLYPILISQGAPAQSQVFGPVEQFARLGEETGGRSFVLSGSGYAAMKAILDNVVVESRTEYVVGYRTAAGPGSGKHRARVRLLRADVGRVRGGEKEFVR